jgi:predicted Co/Zn/Cd cation transporter (cation efflux family)
MHMPTRIPVRILARARTLRVVLAAFAIQASICLVAWFLVNDMSRGRGVFYNKDFNEWLMLGIVSSLVLVAFAGAALRCRRLVISVAAGCLLALTSGVAAFFGWAVFNSA